MISLVLFLLLRMVSLKNELHEVAKYSIRTEFFFFVFRDDKILVYNELDKG